MIEQYLFDSFILNFQNTWNAAKLIHEHINNVIIFDATKKWFIYDETDHVWVPLDLNNASQYYYLKTRLETVFNKIIEKYKNTVDFSMLPVANTINIQDNNDMYEYKQDMIKKRIKNFHEHFSNSKNFISKLLIPLQKLLFSVDFYIKTDSKIDTLHLRNQVVVFNKQEHTFTTRSPQHSDNNRLQLDYNYKDWEHAFIKDKDHEVLRLIKDMSKMFLTKQDFFIFIEFLHKALLCLSDQVIVFINSEEDTHHVKQNLIDLIQSIMCTYLGVLPSSFLFHIVRNIDTIGKRLMLINHAQDDQRLIQNGRLREIHSNFTIDFKHTKSSRIQVKPTFSTLIFTHDELNLSFCRKIQLNPGFNYEKYSSICEQKHDEDSWNDKKSMILYYIMNYKHINNILNKKTSE